MTIQELSKAIEESFQVYAKDLQITKDSPWYILHIEEKLGDLTHSYLKMIGKIRKKDRLKEDLRIDFEEDLADMLCSILLLANAHTIDLEQVIKDKWLVWNNE